MTPLIFLAVGLLFIFIEFFLPGAIFGISGAALILISLILFGSNGLSPLLFVGYSLLTLAAVAAVIKLALVTIRHTSSSQSYFSDDDQAGYVASSFDKAAIGKQGIVLTDLKPAGYVIVDEQKLQARSESGYIVAGSTIEVTAGDEDTLVVKLIERKKL